MCFHVSRMPAFVCTIFARAPRRPCVCIRVGFRDIFGPCAFVDFYYNPAPLIFASGAFLRFATVCLRNLHNPVGLQVEETNERALIRNNAKYSVQMGPSETQAISKISGKPVSRLGFVGLWAFGLCNRQVASRVCVCVCAATYNPFASIHPLHWLHVSGQVRESQTHSGVQSPATLFALLLASPAAVGGHFRG